MKHLNLKSLGVAFLATALFTLTRPAAAEETWGCDAACQLECNCHPICSMQLVERTVWDVVAEPVCVGGCVTSCGHSSSACGCESSGVATCDGCDACDAGTTASCRSLFPWLSKPRVRTRNRLVRKTVIDYVPVTTFVAYESPVSDCDDACDSTCDGGTVFSAVSPERSEPEVFWMEARSAENQKPSVVKLELGGVKALRSLSDSEGNVPTSMDVHVADVVRASEMAPALVASDLNSDLDDASATVTAHTVLWLEAAGHAASSDAAWGDDGVESLPHHVSAIHDSAATPSENSETETRIHTAHRSLIDAGFDIHPSELPLTAPATLPPVIRQ